MKSANSFLALLLLFLGLQTTGCNGTTSNPTTPGASPAVIPLSNGATLPTMSGSNVMTLTVNGSTCSANSYPNKPCVSITLCSTAGTNCQTINDILLDTGSYGLRVFKDVLNAGLYSSLTNVQNGSNPIAECVQYGDGSKQWGPVKIGRITLGGETPVQTPIQVVDSTFTGMASKCSGAMTSSSSAGLNGILGMGLFQFDCGYNCAISANNGSYYSCDTTAGACTGSTVSLANQVQNPVALLPQDNNGVLIEFPDIPSGSATSVDGYLIFGIGTQANNTPSGKTKTYFADSSYGEFTTTYAGGNYSSFIDSGSNSYAFPYSGTSLTGCSGAYTGWFCPSSTTTLSAINNSVSDSTSGTIQFQIGNFINFYSSVNNVSKEVGAKSGSGIGGLFDWGLPFYIGRNVYHGIDGKSSSLGSGPYWAY